MPLRFLSPIHKAGRQIAVHLGEYLQAFGLDSAEGHTLSYLRSYSPCPVGELVRVFGHRPSTMTSILDRLEQRRLIERRTNPDDRRSFLVGLTSGGLEVADQMLVLLEKLENQIAERVTEADLDGFNAVMSAIGWVTDVQLREERER
jgi:DNA-binding MarR family transcriptional regulator